MAANDLDSSRDELDRLQDEVSRLRRELSMRDAEFAACRGELEQARHDLTRSQEQQDATVDVLRAIATSPDDLQGIVDTVVRQATELGGAELAIVQRVDGEYLPIVAWHARPGAEAAMAGMRELERTGYWGSPYRRTSISGTAFLERRTVHVPDTDLVAETFPALYATSRQAGQRTVASIPLLHGGEVLGILALLNFSEPRPFTERQLSLLEAFANQAAIAIATAELFQQVEQRNAELQESNRQVTESLEQQTALGEVLRVIAASPTDVQHVLDAICETAARLCDTPDAAIHRYRARDGHLSISAATRAGYNWIRQVYGTTDFDLVGGFPLSREGVSGRAFLDQRAIVVDDLAEAVKTEFPGARAAQARWGQRSQVTVPLVNRGESIGVLTLARREPRPFTERQIALLETFADQAVIAIENARLFEELQERTSQLARSVDELRTLGEVGQAVSSSLDLEEVLATVVDNAVRLCGAGGGVIHEYDDEAGIFQVRATTLLDPDVEEALQTAPPRIGETVIGRAAAIRGPVQREDLLDGEIIPTLAGRLLMERGFRSLLSVQILRQDQVLGAVTVARTVPGAFPPEVVALLQTFAAQSALAIHNARLYAALDHQGRALAEASQHKSQFLANMSHELRTPLNAVIGYSEMLQEELEDLDQAGLVPDVEKINAAGRHLLGVISDILDLSKIEAGRMDLFVETFEIRQLAQDVAAIVLPLVEKNGNTLVVTCPDDLGVMQADQTKVRQVLFNLLSNAAKFTDHGTIALRVGTHLEPDNRVGAGFQDLTQPGSNPNLPAQPPLDTTDPSTLPASSLAPRPSPLAPRPS